MTRKQISSGSKFETEIGYSRAIVDGDWIWVSGTTGFNYETMTISQDVAEQAEQTFRNIKAAMEQAGFSLDDVVRATYIFPNAADFAPCWPVLRTWGPARSSTSIRIGLRRFARPVRCHRCHYRVRLEA